MPENVDTRLAAETDMKVWTWVRKKASRDRDLSAALDILKYFVIHQGLLPLHVDAANKLLEKSNADENESMIPDNPTPLVKTGGKDPAVILKRMQDAGMLRGKNGAKAFDLLKQSKHWSQAQLEFATELADKIQKSAIVYVGLKEIADYGKGGRFIESLVESFDDWGSYTPKQLEAARNNLVQQTGHDPVEELERMSAPKKPIAPDPNATPFD